MEWFVKSGNVTDGSRQLFKARDEAINREYRAGVKVTELAERCGITTQQVYWILKVQRHREMIAYKREQASCEQWLDVPDTRSGCVSMREVLDTYMPRRPTGI